jgi:hypothetical protein
MEHREPFNYTNQPQLEPKFSYDNILNTAIHAYKNERKIFGWRVQGEKYYAEPKGNFIYIIKDGEPNSNRAKGGGLKFHVSIHPDDFGKGLSILIDTMAKYGITEAKFPNPLIKDKPDDLQESGKEICIYAFLEPEREILDLDVSTESKEVWKDIIIDLTDCLQKENIRPGALAAGSSASGTSEKPITGTDYISWRNDDPYLDSQEVSVSEEASERHNKYNENFNIVGRHLLRKLDIQQRRQERLSPEEHQQRREELYQQLRDKYGVPHGIKGIALTSRPLIHGRSTPNYEKEINTTDSKPTPPSRKNKPFLSANSHSSSHEPRMQPNSTITDRQNIHPPTVGHSIRARAVIQELNKIFENDKSSPDSMIKRRGPGNSK